MPNVFCGTSGFAFKEWKGVFYPEGLSDKKMLEYYSGVLNSVEVNYTFRRLPSETTLQNWAEQVNEGFRFTLKASQRITHFKRLKEVDEDVAEFVRRARLLGDKLGTILFQLPPNMVANAELLATFLTGLPPVARYAMEFRHPSWSDQSITDLLTEHAVARCGADTEESPIDAIPMNAPHAYLRLRKEEYPEEELQAWQQKIHGSAASGMDIFCYFKHEDGATGPMYARKMLAPA